MSKYKIGQKFQDGHDIYTTYTILAVSPDVDYQGEHSYFVEMLSHGNQKYYNAVYDSTMKDDIEII